MESTINWIKSQLWPSYLTWKDDWALLLMGWLLLSIVLWLIIYLMLLAIDYAWRPIQTGQGIVTSTRFIPSHYNTTYIWNEGLKTNVPMTTYHPDAWSWTIEINGCTDNFYVDQNRYSLKLAGDTVTCTYTTGRIWRSLYIKSVTF